MINTGHFIQRQGAKLGDWTHVMKESSDSLKLGQLVGLPPASSSKIMAVLLISAPRPALAPRPSLLPGSSTWMGSAA